MVDHGPHCDADLRLDGCVCLDVAEQEARLRELAAEWADMVAKQQAAETDRLAAEAFGNAS